MDNFLIFKLLDSYYFDLVSSILCRIMDKVYTYYVERHFSNLSNPILYQKIKILFINFLLYRILLFAQQFIN